MKTLFPDVSVAWAWESARTPVTGPQSGRLDTALEYQAARVCKALLQLMFTLQSFERLGVKWKVSITCDI